MPATILPLLKLHPPSTPAYISPTSRIDLSRVNIQIYYFFLFSPLKKYLFIVFYSDHVLRIACFPRLSSALLYYNQKNENENNNNTKNGRKWKNKKKK